MNKPTKPSETLPSSFGGVKENFSPSKISSGYQKNIRDILGGANLNYLLDTLGKKDAYHDTISDYINALPVNKTIMTDSNNNLVYTQYDIRVYNATETYFKEDYVTGWDNNEKFIYKSLVDNNIGHPVTDTNYWVRTGIIGNGQSRNVGETVFSLLPLQDAGLHLLDGSIIQGTGIYSGFVNYIANLYGDGTSIPNYFTTEANWQTSVSTYGVCGKFVYDSTNNTVRLPKVTGFIEGTIDTNALGDLVEAGLPNIEGVIGAAHSTNGTHSGALGDGAWIGTYIQGTQSQTGLIHANIDFNASWSNPVYGRSNTVQPQTVKGFVYIVIANIVKTDIEVDIDEIATDLNGKLDVDFNNAPNKLANSFLASLTPDWTNKETKSNNTQYTASNAGYVYAYGFTQSAQIAITINGTTYQVGGRQDQYGGGVCCFIPVNKNDTYQTTGNVSSLIFIPLKGAN